MNTFPSTCSHLALAVTWDPRGELSRFLRLLPVLEQVYASMVISLSPQSDDQVFQALAREDDRLAVTVNLDWGRGRYTALEMSLKTPAAAVQYADMDRLLRWVEIRPNEWRQCAAAILKSDCLIFGRTPGAYATHPRALVQTEAVSNQVVSSILGRPMDISAGSKGFSRRAVEYLVLYAEQRRALGADAEWPILLHSAGYLVDYLAVDGLDWESADRYREQAADIETQRQLAQAYDADPQHWQRRVEIAAEIVACAFDAMNRVVIQKP